MRISDWSSDVCSSDLAAEPAYQALTECLVLLGRLHVLPHRLAVFGGHFAVHIDSLRLLGGHDILLNRRPGAGAQLLMIFVGQNWRREPKKIGRASCRERVCTNV